MNYDATIQTVGWINSRRNEGALVISPAFQRRPVWLEKERSSLIETILLKLPFPEVYIQVITDPQTGTQQHIVVDGQQRITSILRFIDGLTLLPDDDRWQNKSFDDLEADIKASFWQYKVVVRMLNTDSEPEIRDLFTRLNTNTVALNPQELRNARFVGRFKQTSERLADNPFFQRIGLFTPREIRRMEDVEYVSELLLRVVEGVTNKKEMLDTAYADYDEDFPRETEFEAEFNAAIQLVVSITNDSNATLFKTKSNFYSLFGSCLLYHRETHTVTFHNPESISAALQQLLSEAKSFDPDANSTVGASVREYHDAVSRASSDKARRVARETILYRVINESNRQGMLVSAPTQVA